MDLSQFRKVKDERDHATLKHKDGHEIRVSKAALNDKTRKQLAGLPMHFDEGGEVPEVFGEPMGMMSSPSEAAPGMAAVSGDGAMVGEAPQATGEIESAASPEMAALPPAAAPAEASPAVAPVGPSGMAGLGMQQAGLRKEAQAIGDLGKQEAQMQTDYAKGLEHLQQEHATKASAIDKEISSLQADIQAAHIDPDRAWNSKSTGGKVSTAIGLLLGGIGAGLTNGTNLAIEAMDREIGRDIEAQKADLGKKENLLSSNFKRLGNLDDAMKMTQIQSAAILQSKLAKAAAESKDPLAKARAQQASGLIQAKMDQAKAQLSGKQAIASMANMVERDPRNAKAYIDAIAQVDPKRADDLRARLVEGAGLAKTKDSANTATMVKDREKNILDNLAKVEAMINKKGMYETLGSHNADMNRLMDQVATDMAKLQDPNSVARPGEVEMNRKNLPSPDGWSRPVHVFQPGSWFPSSTTSSTALNMLKNFRSEVQNRAKTAYGLAGVTREPQSDPAGGVSVREKAIAWARSNPSHPKAKAILRLSGGK